jgi:hypothetical protein
MVFSVGSKNHHGHPSKDAIAACRENDCKIACTELTGEYHECIEEIIQSPIFNAVGNSYGNSTSSNAACCFGTIIIQYSSQNYSIQNFSRRLPEIKTRSKKDAHFNPMCLNSED